MERELLIAVKKDNYDNKRITREIECIKNLFPYLESFETFHLSTEIFDLDKHKVIQGRIKIKHIYEEGVTNYNNFIISLN